MKPSTRVAIAALLVTTIAACAKDNARTGDAAGATGDRRGSPGQAAGAAAPRPAAPTEAVVHFEFDSAALDAGDTAIVQRWAQYLFANPGLHVTLAGHCDERGTREYNTGLGERRAAAVREQLVASGVRPAQISVVSFGEEKPVDAGHDEAAWRRNRRVEIAPR